IAPGSHAGAVVPSRFRRCRAPPEGRSRRLRGSMSERHRPASGQSASPPRGSVVPRDDVTVLIPAAGRVPEGIVANATIATPAMIPVAGRPVIQWMLASLQGLGLSRLRIALPERGLFAEDLITDVFGRAWDVDIVVPEPGGGVADTVLDLAAGV